MIRFLLVAEAAFHVVDENQSRFVIAAGDFFLNGAADRIPILFSERDRLGAIAEQLLLADQVEKNGNLLKAVAQIGEQFLLVLKSGTPRIGKAERNWQRYKYSDDAH